MSQQENKQTPQGRIPRRPLDEHKGMMIGSFFGELVSKLLVLLLRIFRIVK